MVHVAVDAMGGDYAPGEIIKGVDQALALNADLAVTLVGDEERIGDQVKACAAAHGGRLRLLHAPEVIQGDEDPGLAIRRKRNSSLVVALEMVRRGEADAVLSAGSTGALMAGGVLFLGRLEGISRPALLTVLPTFQGGGVVLLDVGAHMDARPTQLLQYAFMGRIYARHLLGCPEPRVGLLNVGTEPKKGNSRTREAYVLFQKYVPGFCGNIEGTDLFAGAADVAVCDGFVGNILLKATEGLARGILESLRAELGAGLRSRIGAALALPALRRLRDRMDSTEYGGAPLVGVKGLCIKCHGSSRAPSIRQALLKQAYPFVALKVTELFQEALAEISLPTKEDGHPLEK